MQILSYIAKLIKLILKNFNFGAGVKKFTYRFYKIILNREYDVENEINSDSETILPHFVCTPTN